MSKYDEEYEKLNLYDFADELVEPLSTVKQDLTKIIYIHYAKERDENEQLQQENNQLKEQRQELRSWLEETIPNTMDTMKRIAFIDVLSKLNELEGKNE